MWLRDNRTLTSSFFFAVSKWTPVLFLRAAPSIIYVWSRPTVSCAAAKREGNHQTPLVAAAVAPEDPSEGGGGGGDEWEEEEEVGFLSFSFRSSFLFPFSPSRSVPCAPAAAFCWSGPRIGTEVHQSSGDLQRRITSHSAPRQQQKLYQSSLPFSPSFLHACLVRVAPLGRRKGKEESNPINWTVYPVASSKAVTVAVETTLRDLSSLLIQIESFHSAPSIPRNKDTTWDASELGIVWKNPRWPFLCAFLLHQQFDRDVRW